MLQSTVLALGLACAQLGQLAAATSAASSRQAPVAVPASAGTVTSAGTSGTTAAGREAQPSLLGIAPCNASDRLQQWNFSVDADLLRVCHSRPCLVPCPVLPRLTPSPRASARPVPRPLGDTAFVSRHARPWVQVWTPLQSLATGQCADFTLSVDPLQTTAECEEHKAAQAWTLRSSAARRRPNPLALQWRRALF